MQLTAAHYAECPEQRDKVTSSHRKMVSAGPSSSHSQLSPASHPLLQVSYPTSQKDPMRVLQST